MSTVRIIKKGERSTKVSGFIQKEKLDVWNNVKTELEKRNGQKLNDSFILNFILGNLQREGKLTIFH